MVSVPGRATRATFLLLALTLLTLLPAAAAFPQDRLCDSSFEDCRTPLLELIRNEPRRIDVAFWFMTDARYSNEIIKRWQAGVDVRVIVDLRANDAHPGSAAIIAQLRDAGVPLRHKSSSGILHWKLMLFDEQNIVQFSAANYSPYGFVPVEPYVDYEDEVIYFADGVESPTVVNSFRTKFEDLWTDTTRYSNYANISTPLTRHYGMFAKDPELNFPPIESYRDRAVSHYDAETSQIDVSMFRITDRAHSDAMIRAAMRGVPVRLLSDRTEYRNVDRLWHAWNVDRMYMAGLTAKSAGLPGIDIRLEAHENVMHQKSVQLHGQGLTIFGSSNWTSPSAGGDLSRQEEHNYFTTRPAFFSWFLNQFERKWNNANPVGATETAPFAPLPPDTPQLVSPADAAAGQGTTVELQWFAGPWGQMYDLYLGTGPDALRPIAVDVELGPALHDTDYKRFTLGGLNGGTTYYWRVVSKTMARRSRTSVTRSFTTGGSPSSQPGLPAPWGNLDVGTAVTGDASASSGTFTVRGAGADIWGAADAFHFVYRSLNGNGTLTARVVTQQNTNAWAKAGVMMREALTADSAHASMFVSPGRGVSFQRRVWTGGESKGTTVGSGAAPYWVRLVRDGNTFTAYASPDGSLWDLIGSETIAMGSTIHVGLPVTSHSAGQLSAVTFDNVSLVEGASDPGDTLAPTASLTSPADGASVSGAVSVSASASDNVGVARVELWIDGTLFATDSAAPYTFDWNTAATNDGSHALQARAYDAAGNVGASDTITVTVANGGDPGDTTDPTASVTSPADGATVSGTVSVTASANDNVGVVRAELWVDGALAAADATAPYAFDWNTTATSDGSHALQARAYDEAGNVGASPVVTVIVANGSGSPDVPAPWSHGDVGAVGAAGSAAESGGIFTVRGAGADVWGTADAFHFVYQTIAGDGEIVARVGSVENVDPWTKAGVMMRETLDAGSRHAFMLVSPGKGLAFQRRRSTGGTSTNTPGGSGTAPAWVKLVRTGHTINAYRSADGASWTFVGSDTIQMQGTILVGLALTSHQPDTLAAATFDNVSVSVPSLPAGWAGQDVGVVNHAGGSSENAGIFTVTGSGADIWGAADAFHYAYRPLTGDGEIVARVAALQNVNQWSKAGVMMRETLDAGSAHASMFVTPSKGLAFQRRTTTGGDSAHTSGGSGTAPTWVRMVRSGTSFSAYVSDDGATWTIVGSDTIAMTETIYVGLAVTSHDPARLCTAAFDGVSIR